MVNSFLLSLAVAGPPWRTHDTRATGPCPFAGCPNRGKFP
ncbi:hypothetical protein DA2_3596 [Desulfovibrio sp. A2]|nr:hypothetical protein DA2_3596 [Desulfovibrio sp. A2]